MEVSGDVNLRPSTKKAFMRVLDPFLNRFQRQSQRFFELLHMLSLVGMNFGGGADPKNSGEEQVIKELASKKGPLMIFDVGANHGSYTLSLLEILGDKDMAIHAFEPSKPAFETMRSKVASERAVLHNFGFGDENKTVTLFNSEKGGGLGSVYKRRLDHFNLNMDLEEQVELRTLDSFCAENGISHIDLLKIDVEGNEMNVLKGAKGMMEKGAIDEVQFEFGGSHIDSRTYFQDFYYLLSPHYKIYRVLRNGLYPVTRYKESQEIFLATNYLAKRK